MRRAGGRREAIKILSDEMERAFGYVGARSVAEIGPHIFAHGVPVNLARAASRASETSPVSDLQITMSNWRGSASKTVATP